MAEIPGLVWFFIGLFVIAGSFWFGNKEENIKRFSLFIGAGGLMILVGLIKMVGGRKGKEEAGGGGKFCPKCGSPVGLTDKFCPKCGNRAA